jgi:hypothetical protein
MGFVARDNDGGSGIHIKKSHEGLFTAKAKAAGMSVSAYANKMANSPNASPATKKQAVFAKNARSWKH